MKQSDHCFLLCVVFAAPHLADWFITPVILFLIALGMWAKVLEEKE